MVVNKDHSITFEKYSIVFSNLISIKMKIILFLLTIVFVLATLSRPAFANSKERIETTCLESNHCRDLIKTNNNSPDVIFYGKWIENKTQSLSENDEHISNIQFNNCFFTFRKSEVKWVGSKGANHGYADVYIDGILQETVDTYSEKTITGQVLFEKNGLSDDRIHTLNIVVKKEKNIKSSGYCQSIDYFESQEPVNYREWLKEMANAELENIENNTKYFPSPENWSPVSNKTHQPDKGVILLPGVLNECFIKNIRYLNHCFSKPIYCDEEYWTTWLPGSNDGRMLQGAGNALRWGERSDMRDIVNIIVSKIESQQRADGYSNYYNEKESYALNYLPRELIDGHHHWNRQYSERKNYDRVFWTRGLLAAGSSGNQAAFTVLRQFYNWFNSSSYLEKLMDGSNSTNGAPGGGLVYFSPVGENIDIHNTQKYFDQEYWINELINENPLCFAYYPMLKAHCYELLTLEAFIDEYRATGDEKYINAVKGGWNIYNDNYKHIGGITAICENTIYPPKSYILEHDTSGKTAWEDSFHNGETCGSVFWININSKLLQLYPTEEKYAAEIEQGIYNTLLSCHDDRGFIRYHAFLQGTKEPVRCMNSCCENSAVGMIASLPQYIYSLADDGININLFAASTINWQQGGDDYTLVMNTGFPKENTVSISVKASSTQKMNVRVRIPSWTKGDVSISVNDTTFVTGKPGTYVTIDRAWSNGDLIKFDLPMKFSFHRYTGLSQDEEHDKYAVMYGPMLMSFVGDSTLNVTLDKSMFDDTIFKLNDWKNIAFDIEGNPDCTLKPYFIIAEEEEFTCYPVLLEK